MTPFAVGSACALACIAALAGEARADDAGDGVDEVSVRGSAAAGFTSRASVDDARREVTDAASLLEPLPGVHVRRLGADDAFSTLSIRGSGSNQVAVYLAGVPLTGGGDPSLDLSTLPLWPGSTARVYRSFAPATLGPGSLGGTLALDPPRTTASPGTEVWAAAGSFGAARVRVGDVRALDWGGDARVVTGLSASRSDDDFAYFDPSAGAFLPRANAGHAAVSGLVAVARPIAWGRGVEGALHITTLLQSRRQGLPGTLDRPTPRDRLASSRLVEAIEVTRPAGDGALVARVWGRRESFDVREAGALSIAETDQAIVAAGGAAGWRGRAARAFTLDARVDASGERFVTVQGEGADATRELFAGGADATWRATRALTWSASGRAEAWRDTQSSDSRSSAAREAEPTGHIGAELGDGPLSVAAHAGRVARPASFLERFGDRGAFLGSPDLRTESAWTVDLGARAATRVGAMRLRVEAVGFATWARDLITFVAQGAFGRLKAENIGRARIAGGELDAGATWGGLDLHAAYTGLLAVNASDGACVAAAGATCERPPLPGRPAHDLVADASYAAGPLRARYGVDLVSGIRADLAGDVVVPARALHSAGLRLDVPGVRGLRVAADVRNLFDLRVASYDGVRGPVDRPIGDAFDYPLPGRSVLVSARWVTP